ncbi:hypothetical protein HCH_01996 [Hahella chejuensis KCTC 2396]|uniref:Uncharacterized protein n=1 Tax=Hahella chejuensis (strain KCTC 2396) TaxID=349521 RepID=Q2SKJ4_HAHCH|nr:hypothetical protein [Hahella chejuensis]ABC28830.1 hypothetical protein HCH_01996 [Hahella chejuensis KCTC 2396]
MFFKEKHRLALACGVVAALSCSYWLLGGEGADISEAEAAMTPAVDSPSVAAAAVAPVKKTASPGISSPSMEPGVTESEEDQEASENPFFEKEVKARLTQIADQYQDQIQYPSFSNPIRDKEALAKYLPNKSIPAGMPLDFKDPDSPRISLETTKSQYFIGEDIVASVSVTGLQAGIMVEAEGRLVEQGNALAVTEGVQRGGSAFNLIFSGDDPALADAGSDLRVIANLTINGRAYEIGTPVSYTPSVAQVTHVGAAEVRGAYLYIPLHVRVNAPGYHEVSAILYSADAAEPLVHLSAQEDIQVENGLAYLRAHIAALKQKGDAGPYRLRDISLTRMPAPPTYQTEYGSVAQSSFAVNGFPFSDYDDVPYVDEDAQKRLEFLRQLGSVQ